MAFVTEAQILQSRDTIVVFQIGECQIEGGFQHVFTIPGNIFPRTRIVFERESELMLK